MDFDFADFYEGTLYLALSVVAVVIIGYQSKSFQRKTTERHPLNKTTRLSALFNTKLAQSTLSLF